MVKPDPCATSFPVDRPTVDEEPMVQEEQRQVRGVMLYTEMDHVCKSDIICLVFPQ